MNCKICLIDLQEIREWRPVLQAGIDPSSASPETCTVAFDGTKFRPRFEFQDFCSI